MPLPQFLSLLQNDLIRDMVVVYTRPRAIAAALAVGLPVCGHPTIVHGGLISAIIDETFGVLLYAAGRHGHVSLETGVFTARLEVNYKQASAGQRSETRMRRRFCHWCRALKGRAAGLRGCQCACTCVSTHV
jgi:Thioesterase superfamily